MEPYWTSGGFTWVTRQAINRVGGRDEDFFVYGEDVEHAHRIKESGLKVLYTPKARALHYGSSSTRQNIDSCREDVYKGLLLYWRKRQPGKYFFAKCIILFRLLTVAIFAKFLPGKASAARAHFALFKKLLTEKA